MPLEAAARSGNLAIVEYLAAKGAQNPYVAYEGARNWKHYDVADFLLDAGMSTLTILPLTSLQI
jgi:ankyrin repeat protein